MKRTGVLTLILQDADASATSTLPIYSAFTCASKKASERRMAV